MPEDTYIEWLSMTYTIAAHDLPGSQPQNSQIKGKRPPSQVRDIEGHLLGNGYLVATIDLGPACYARP
jgi:hypothetical protein